MNTNKAETSILLLEVESYNDFEFDSESSSCELLMMMTDYNNIIFLNPAWCMQTVGLRRFEFTRESGLKVPIPRGQTN